MIASLVSEQHVNAPYTYNVAIKVENLGIRC